MKELKRFPIGDSGEVVLALNEGKIQVNANYAIGALVMPLKEKILGAIKNVIPGSYEDKLLEEGWEKLMVFLGVPAAPALAPTVAAHPAVTAPKATV